MRISRTHSACKWCEALYSRIGFMCARRGKSLVDRDVYFERGFLNLCTQKFNPIVEGEARPNTSDQARHKYRHQKFPRIQHLLQ